MGYIAQWGPKGFLISPSKIVTLEGLQTSVSLKSDSENDTSGTARTNTRGLQLRPVSFSVTYTRATGTDPRAQLEEWESLVGQSHPLYIGSKRFGPSSLLLKQVTASDYVLSPAGDILSVTISVSMEEESKGNTSNVAASSVSPTNTASANKAASVYAETVEKRRAMDASPSPDEKARILSSNG